MSLIPSWRPRFPRKRASDLFSLGDFFEDVESGLTSMASHPSGLSVSSDEKNIYVEAHVPGLTAKDIEVSIDSDNILWVKGEKHEEEKDKKKQFYRRSQSSFSYCIPLWEEVDASVEPEATCKDGVMKITFAKKKEKQIESKKIKVKE